MIDLINCHHEGARADRAPRGEPNNVDTNKFNANNSVTDISINIHNNTTITITVTIITNDNIDMITSIHNNSNNSINKNVRVNLL